MIRNVIILTITLLLGACSVTKNIPSGEKLYTGTKKIELVNEKEYTSSTIGQQAVEEVMAALECPPNAAIMGSSNHRGIPIGLWLYNGFEKNNSKLGKWIYNTFATTPILISTVNPTLRTQVATNILRNFGYFNGRVTSEIIQSKNPKKAKVSYRVVFNEPYYYDSVAYMNFSSRADTLIKETWNKRIVYKGEQFSVPNLSAERERINSMLRNNGYYYYQSGYINLLADSINNPGFVSLRILPATNIPPQIKRPWYIGNVTFRVTDNNSRSSRQSTERGDIQPMDTFRYKEFSYYYRGKKMPVRPAVVLRNTELRSGKIYSQEDQSLTLQQLSQLNIFNGINFEFVPSDSTPGCNVLNMNITTQLDKPFDISFELNATSKSNSQIGPGSKISFARNNLFRGGEILKLTLQGSYEWQTDSKIKGDQSVINSWEVGTDVSLTFPRFFLPLIKTKHLRYNSSSTYRIYIDQMNRSGFFKMVHLGGEASYRFMPKPTLRYTITPFRLTYDMLQRTTEKFDSIMTTNPSIANSFRDQFIPAMQFSITYDNANTGHRNKTWWENSVTSSGNLTSAIFSMFGKSWNEKDKNILDNPYAQFLKVTTEIRNLYRISSKHYIASRFCAGAIYSYGNSTIPPYSEQFYIGGANSLRGFTVRSIGPGGYHPKASNRYSYLDETGTLKFEANIEYRFNIFGDLYGALFMDAGNIWLMKNDDSRPNAQIRLKDIGNQIALNTGVGLRYDLEFLVLRIDLGIPLHYPYDTGKKGYYNIPSFNKGFAWHFAIGYPF